MENKTIVFQFTVLESEKGFETVINGLQMIINRIGDEAKVLSDKIVESLQCKGDGNCDNCDKCNNNVFSPKFLNCDDVFSDDKKIKNKSYDQITHFLNGGDHPSRIGLFAHSDDIGEYYSIRNAVFRKINGVWKWSYSDDYQKSK